MNLRPLFLLLAFAAGGTSLAQFVPPPLPARGPAPLLFVRLSGLPGMRVTFYQGRAPARAFDLPVVVGLRPGYVYRVELSGIPGQTIRLYPTLEVQGSLHLPPGLNAANFPVPINFNEVDLSSAFSGNLLTKMIYLEDPDKALPIASDPSELLETILPPNSDLQAAARLRGRPMMVLRLGDGSVSAEELVKQSVPGTILHPGEKALSRPACPPTLPPPVWAEEECLHDGGDRGDRARLDGDGRLAGIDPEDTVAEFTDSRGRRGVTCSNRVCLCVPRFAALRTEIALDQANAIVGPNARQAVHREVVLEKRQPIEQARITTRLENVTGQKRPSVALATKGPGTLVHLEVLQAHHIYQEWLELIGTVEMRTITEVQRTRLAQQVKFALEMSSTSRVRGMEQIVSTGIVGRVEPGAEVVVGTLETRDITVSCHEAPLPPDKPLLLVKLADVLSAKVGDVVTFTLRYSNHGGRPITDVAVTDSLSGRLEYVPGSAEADRPAVFTTQENEAGSLVLRWEISGRLLPGESGRLRFKARVR